MDNFMLFGYIYCFIVGICMGSFFNVCIYRIPGGESIVSPPSHCYNCNTRLRSADLVPVFSYLFLGGKCRYCGTKISFRYPAIELLTGILYLLVFSVYGFSMQSLYYIFLASLLVIISFIDLDHFIIPDKLLIIGAVFGLAYNILGYGISFLDGIYGALVSVGFLLFILLLEFILKKEAMGGGDIKLLGMLGIFLGLKYTILTIILAIYIGAICGILVIIYNKIKNNKYNTMIPFGPFISLGAIISLLYGSNIIDFYMKFYC
jgi:leader peptidase (prepilin peptidase) / N-methyltransferase